ncbi:hypothetical protein [Pseudooceanicola sp.]|uniref:COG4223 family protein n=1 Tax=Pseudooceanicola sp. TaxID=1914328 RepID=UPI002607CB2D|nr:hypothetical protein [Pseudooceanicola sp.]MDF1857023.1 hypothetical protein [Pseudooceanicola sp.]
MADKKASTDTEATKADDLNEAKDDAATDDSLAPGADEPQDAAPGDDGDESDDQIDAATDDEPEAAPEADAEDAADEPAADPIDDILPPAPAPAPVKRRGGFLPGFLGGLIAAALIVGAAYVYLGQQSGQDQAALAALRAQQTATGTALAELRDSVEAGPDLSPVADKIDEVAGQINALSGRIDATKGTVEALNARIIEIEKRPISEGISESAIAAYEEEVNRLRAAMEKQREEVEALINEARQMETDASATAESTLRRAALTRILSALDNGTPYSAALADLQAAGQQVPEALVTAASTGVASLGKLRDAYPEAARRALAAARATGGDDKRSVGDFLRDLLGARSLEPRSGDTADAILSRAESALKAGRLGDTLAELEALPDQARAEMSGWMTNASTRQAAVAAAEDLSAALNAG